MFSDHEVVPDGDTIAVLCRDADFILIRLDSQTAKRESMAALAKGYIICGYFGTERGAPVVRCNPGLLAALSMVKAGAALAAVLCTEGTVH